MSGLRLCAGLADTYRVGLLAGQRVAAVARDQGRSERAPLRVTIRDPAGAVIAEGEGGGVAVAQADGEYRVSIDPPGEAPITYELTATTVAAACDPDAGEPDDTPAQARALGPGTFLATLCPGDVDHYSFHLEPGQAAGLTLFFDWTRADLDLVLFEAGSDVPVRVSAGGFAPEEVEVEASRATDYVARVDAAGLGSAPYSIDLRVGGQSSLCTDDLFAPNAEPAQSATLPEGTWDRLRLCPGDADYFRHGLNGGEALTARVEVGKGLAAPPVAILDGDTILAGGEMAGEVAAASLTVPRPGTYLVRVGPAPDEALAYSLTLAAEDQPGPCRPDRMEPDDDLETAPALAAGLTTHLTMCAGDADFFAVQLGAWESIRVFILPGTAQAHATLLRAGAALLASGQPTGYGEELVFVVDAKGTYHVKVEGTGAEGWYDLGLETR